MSGVYAVILAGGAGTRFWPASRAGAPKQLLPLAGDPDESLLAATARRLAPLVPAERIYVATSAALLDATAKVLPGVPRTHLLAEPAARNTAPAIAWAARTILRSDREATIAVLPSDHHIGDPPGFLRAVEAAIGAAGDGSLVTIGIKPTRPETGYGYIEVGVPLEGGAFRVTRFVEKPDRVRAEAFLEGGRHLWNAGMFFFRGAALVRAIEEHLPELARGLEAIDQAAARGDERAALERVFPGLPAVSIDHGVLEKADKVAVVPGDFGWNDVGSWESAWELSPHDAHGNTVPSGAVLVDARGNLVSDRTTGDKRRVYALVGVSDLVVVETDDAVLIIPRDRAQDVRAVVEELRRRGDGERL